MDRSLRSMGPLIEVLTGIAGSGKTARLLGRYRETLTDAQAAGDAGTTLWLTPTARSRNGILEALCDGSLSVVFSPNVFTFHDFAERVLVSSTQRVAPLSPTMQRMILRRIVDRLLDQKELRYYAGIAGTAGFLDLVASFIAELKRSETWPEDFLKACCAPGSLPRQRDRELAEIYRRYQNALLDHGVYDSEGRFWSACQSLKNGEWGAFERLDLVVLDGFSDFTHTQLEILRLLAGRAQQFVVSLPLEEPTTRGDLFAKSKSVLEQLRRIGQVSLVPLSGSTASVPSKESANRILPPAVEHVSRHLFANARSISRAESADGLEIVAAAGQQGEVNWLAARVKTLLIEGARPEQIVIAFRDLADYRDLIVDTFESAGIPASCASGIPLDRVPVCRALIQVLQLEAEDWPFRRLLGVLDSSFFQPDWNELGGAAIRSVAEVLRRFKLGEGRERILEWLREACREAEAPAAPADADRLPPFVLNRARRLLERLSRVTEKLRQPHDLEHWAQCVGSLITDLGFAKEPPGIEGLPTNLATSATDDCDRVERLLFDAAKSEKILGEEPVRRTLPQFLLEFSDLLKHADARMAASESGRVRVLSTEHVRNLDVPYLFVAGLTERSFPRRQNDDCLFSEFERRALNDRGLRLAHRAERAQEEMLMFYSVVTRARKRLTLSYPAVSANGEPLSCSPYLTALQELFTTEALPVHLEEQLDPIPTPERVLSNSDARVRGLFETLDRKPGLLRSVAEIPGNLSTVQAILSAADMHAARFHSPGFTNFEGVLENPENLAWVAERYSPAREFSATQLEAYAACPFQYFVSNLLGVEPLPVVELETEYGRRGTLVHDILAELHRTLAGETDAARVESDVITARFHELLEDRLGRYPAGSEVDRSLLEIEARLLREWGTAYGEQHTSFFEDQPEGCDRPPVPSLFEMAFGKGRRGAGEDLERAALIVGDGERSVRISGRIDRIDVGKSAGKTVFSVIDYKTGKTRSDKFDEIASGRALQLALYTLAVIRLDLAGPGARPLLMGYWHIRDQGFTSGLRSKKKGNGHSALEEAVWETLMKTLDELIPKLAAAMRAGQFPVYNSDAACTGRCPFHTVCRVSQIRALPEALAKIWSP